MDSYVEDTRDHHNFVIVSFDRDKALDNYKCTRCGEKLSIPYEAGQFPYDKGVCTRRLPIAKEIK